MTDNVICGGGHGRFPITQDQPSAERVELADSAGCAKCACYEIQQAELQSSINNCAQRLAAKEARIRELRARVAELEDAVKEYRVTLSHIRGRAKILDSATLLDIGRMIDEALKPTGGEG